MDLTLYLVTDGYNFSEDHFLAIVEEAVAAGVTIVQYRDKDATTREAYELAKKIQKITKKYQVSLIINDRVDVALAIGADGVHIGDDELPVATVRQLIGPDMILGVSAKRLDQALAAETEGADYLGVGAMFPTTTKDSDVVNIGVLKVITSHVHIPTVAIGGIHLENLNALKDTGITGISLVSEIMLADNITKRIQALNNKLVSILEETS